MQEYPGKFIVLEGSDGSGKNTQFNLLAERLRAVGYEVEVFDFPRYDQPSSHFVQRYLGGHYGPASQINPYAASMFYALDRYEAAPEIRQALRRGKIVLSNRYAGSNMAHQGSKFEDETEQRGFFVWADSLEFSLLGIPRPDINLFLRVPTETAERLIKTRAHKTGIKPDEHEKDTHHLRATLKAYDLLCQLFPKDFVAIECTERNRLLDIPTINNRIWDVIQPLLPASPPHKGRKTVVKLEEDHERPHTHPAAAPEAESDHLTVEITQLSLLAASVIEAAPGILLRFKHPWDWGAKDGKYQYYLPPTLSPLLAKNFNSAMKKLIVLQRQMQTGILRLFEQQKKSASQNTPKLEDLIHHCLQPTIPLAALTSGTVVGSSASINLLALQLEANQLPEFKALAKILRVAFKAEAVPHAHPSTSKLTALLKSTDLPTNLALAGEPLKLLEFWPRSEFSLLVDGIYPYTDLGRNELSDGVERWTYERKETALRTLVADSSNSVLEQVRYRWDALSDRSTISEAIASGLVDDPRLQSATPRYGYELPEPVERVGLENEFIECFDGSLKLFSELQSANRGREAAYAALLGHKSRWQFSTNAQRLFFPSTPIQRASGLDKLIAALREKVREVHPLLAAALEKQSAKALLSLTQAKTDKKTKPRQRSKKTN
ncbi:MAG: thymidylate kinase [Candidatus Saccharimonadales bacterium]|jgi:dTMP kinase